jgi:chromosome segregation ATPase
MNFRWALGWLGMAVFLILAGCGKMDVEVSNLNKTAHDLKQQMADLKKSYGELSGAIDRLSDSQKTMETEYGDLKRVSDYLKNSTEQRDSEYGNLVASLEQLRSSQTKLDSTVTSLAAELSRRGTESYGAKVSVPERSAARDLETRPTYAENRGKVKGRISAEACEAVEKYMKSLNTVTRSSYGATQDKQMDNALTDLKQVMNQFTDHENAMKILALAEEAKWYAYNASRSRTYIAGEAGWENLLKENKRKLMSVCSR